MYKSVLKAYWANLLTVQNLHQGLKHVWLAVVYMIQGTQKLPRQNRSAISLVTDRVYSSNRSTLDHAPGHSRDDCTVTGATGLIQERKEFLKSKNAWRPPLPDTPQYVVGNQFHDVFNLCVRKRLDWLIGHAKAKDLATQELVSTVCRKPDFESKRGYKRNPTLFLMCLAVAIEKSLLSKRMVLAVFCKCGFYDKADCHVHFDVTLEDLAKGEQDF